MPDLLPSHGTTGAGSRVGSLYIGSAGCHYGSRPNQNAASTPAMVSSAAPIALATKVTSVCSWTHWICEPR